MGWADDQKYQWVPSTKNKILSPTYGRDGWPKMPTGHENSKSYLRGEQVTKDTNRSLGLKIY